jgi:uncharacterized membrane protein
MQPDTVVAAPAEDYAPASAASPSGAALALGPKPAPRSETLDRVYQRARDWLLGGNTVVRVGPS